MFFFSQRAKTFSNYRPRRGKIIDLVASVRTCLSSGVRLSVISGRVRVIARMRSIGFYLQGDQQQ